MMRGRVKLRHVLCSNKPMSSCMVHTMEHLRVTTKHLSQPGHYLNTDSWKWKGKKACYELKWQTTIGYGSCNAEEVCLTYANYSSIIHDKACNACSRWSWYLWWIKNGIILHGMFNEEDIIYINAFFGFWCPSGLLLLSILTSFSYHYLLLVVWQSIDTTSAEVVLGINKAVAQYVH